MRFRQALKAHHAGRLAGCYRSMPAEPPPAAARQRLRIHFWTPQAWSSTTIHVERVLPLLRAQAAALRLPWQITSGRQLPEAAVDWLLCLKAVPPRRLCSAERTVLLLNDDADRVWDELVHFGHVVSVSSPTLASLLGAVHPRVWFVEETECTSRIAQGQRALDQRPPSRRPALLAWHGLRDSLDGLRPLRPALEAFARETGAEMTVVTDLPAHVEQWDALRVRFVAWSPEALVEMAASARLGVVPARPSLADSYLKSAGRLRCLFALGCPAIGDARSPDVVSFSAVCDSPSAHTAAEWLEALRRVWHDPVRLDAVACRGHALVRERYSAARTAAQWLWFLAGGTDTPSG